MSRRGGRGRRVLYVVSRRASFVAIDREIVREAAGGGFAEYEQPGRVPRLHEVVPAVLRADLVVAWFASWHSFVPITLCWLLRKPSVLICGGFDTAAEHEIGYGLQRGGARRHLARWVIRRARVVVTNSASSRREIARTVGRAPDRVRVVLHGLDDPFGALPAKPDGGRPLVLTVGVVDELNLLRKGIAPFVAAAPHLPDCDLVVVGRVTDAARARLGPLPADNVRLAGWVEDDELEALLRRARVYVQPSVHEGFGLSVAEAMLAGCVPVVSDRTALPEVVGDTGVLLDGLTGEDVAAGVRRALALGPEGGAAARERVLREFPRSRRRAGILAALDAARPDR